MKNPGELKILIIGMGHIGGYLRPCYESILGDKMTTNMMAVKGTDCNIAKKQKEFGFPILINENKRALEELNPDIILFATKPSQVRDITCNVLKPYYDSLREEGKEMPDLYVFAPDPPITFYGDVLGSDVNAVNIIPNMVDKIQNLYVAPIAYSTATFDPRRKWPKQNRDFVFQFMAPLGQTMDVALDAAYPVLAAKISCHSLYEINFVISNVLNECGIPISHNETASAMRAFLRSRFDTFAPDIYHCSRALVDKKIQHFIKLTIQNWYDGIIDFCHDKGVDSYVSGRFVRGIMEMHLLTVQIESREKLYLNSSQHATKGGILENSIRTFNGQYGTRLGDALRRYLDGCLEDMFWQQWHGMAYELTAITNEFSSRVSNFS